MWVTAGAILLLPVALMWGFNRTNRADSRGRRATVRWHT